MRNVIPFTPPDGFAKAGIDWTKDAVTERERSLREAYLTHETSSGPDGLVSVVLLERVSRRRGAVAKDLAAAADFAEVMLAMKLRKHQHDVLDHVRSYLSNSGDVWS